MKKPFITIREMAEIGMLAALAVILNLQFLRIQVQASGGSIDFAMVPLFVLCYRHGFIKGFFGCGIIYGLIACLADQYGIFTYPLDYLMAFGSISFAGLFANLAFPKDFIIKNVWLDRFFLTKNKFFFLLSIFVANFARFSFHVISGILVYETSFWGSVVYNVSYMLPSFVICLIALVLLYKPLVLINRIYPVNPV